MGAACCVAAKDRTIICGSPVTATQRHSHNSPSWSFRWDNRVRVVGEETTVDWLRNEGRDDDRFEVKSGTTAEATFASDEGSPIDSFRSLTWQKSPGEGNGKSLMLPSSDPVASRYLHKVKESSGSLSVSCPFPTKLSSSVPCVSSLPGSPLSSQTHLFLSNATPSRVHHRSFARQISDSQIPEYRSPTFAISEEPSVWGNESTRGSSESWSIPAFSEQLITNQRERWSFDSEISSIFSHEKLCRNSEHKSESSFDMQSCGICSKLLTESSSWSWTTQKLISFNEIAVVAVLTCGHAYHSECLEYMTPDINKYDPACPVCAFGEKKTAKLCDKALRIEWESMSTKSTLDRRTKDTRKTSGRRDSKISSSSTRMPFLRRYFSLGSGSIPQNQTVPRKSFFWARSSKY